MWLRSYWTIVQLQLNYFPKFNKSDSMLLFEHLLSNLLLQNHIHLFTINVIKSWMNVDLQWKNWSSRLIIVDLFVYK